MLRRLYPALLIGTPISVTNPEIKYADRIDFADPAMPLFSHSGASVRARFQGSLIAVSLENEAAPNVFNILADVFVIHRRPKPTYPL